jgi:glycosyltransferase involved in cell wall biosynthesis
MRICLVSQEYPPDTVRGGVGVQTWNKARTLTRLGHTVDVLSCAAGPGPDLQTDIQDGITVHRMQPPDSGFSVYETPTYWIGYSWLVLRHLHSLMQRTAFDVIDFPEYGAEGFAYQLDRTPWNWAPVVVQLHAPLAMLAEYMEWPDKESDFYRVGTFMEELSIKRADALMACSGNIADFTAHFFRVPPESIDVVHCGVDDEAFRPPDERSKSPQRPTVLFVGNIADNKGVQIVLEAVLKIRPRHPNILLQIVGKSSDDKRLELQSRASSEGAGAHVEFPGFVDRDGLPPYYRNADVFCSPAQYEGGVANVYIEAMACGCPVVASTAGGASEAVIHEETGLLVPPLDVEAVATALDRVLVNPALRHQMGEAARKRVEQYFGMEKYIQRVLATYKRAIENASHKLACLKTEID